MTAGAGAKVILIELPKPQLRKAAFPFPRRKLPKRLAARARQAAGAGAGGAENAAGGGATSVRKICRPRKPARRRVSLPNRRH